VASGAFKCVDPVGTAIYIEKYLASYSLSELAVASEAIAIVLMVVEFAIGLLLILGVWRKGTALISSVMLLFFLVITLLSATVLPIGDCGCFGDAVVLTNWETFWKNVVLLIMSIIVLKYRKRLFPLVTIRFDWVIAMFGFIYILCMTVYCYRELPVFDFRPYHVGADIRQGMEIPEGAPLPQFEEPILFLLIRLLIAPAAC
jgi:uncharacterized membrane protein YphA (DoxX/SURF4 family)